MNHCSEGCPTPGAHRSWGECVRSKATRIGYANSAGGWDLSKEKRFQRENEAYVQALKDGLNPQTPTWPGIRKAYAEAENRS